MLWTFNHQLLGPQHPPYKAVQPPRWEHPETANSSSIKYIGFRDGVPDLAWATWTLVWQPNQDGSSRARLIAMDTGGEGYGTWEEIVVFDGASNSGPTPQGEVISEAIYRYGQAGVDKYIGFQVYGNNRGQSLIWESRLMIEWATSPEYMAAAAAGRKYSPRLLNHRPPNWPPNFERLQP